MTCQICVIHERDVKDIARRIEEVQTRKNPDTRADTDMELRALTAAKADLQNKYMQHRAMARH